MNINKLLAGVSLGAIMFAAPAMAAEVKISCGAVGLELELCKTGAEAWAQKTGNTVKIVSTPNSSTERLALYQQILAGGSSDIDVFQIDVIWPGMMGSNFIDLKPYLKGGEKEYFASLVENNTVGGKLVALPWFADVGIVYYRKDLLDKYKLKVPETWSELETDAKAVQEGERKAGNNKFWGYVFQGKAYEGLTCNGLEWIDSFGGGTIVDGSGKVTVNNAKAVAALDTIAGFIGTISPEGVLNYSEEESRGVWQAGNAAFLRSWPYAWQLGNAAESKIKDKFEVTAVPKGGADGKHSGTLGGWEIAVSKFSKSPDAAASLAMYLTSPEEQKRRAIAGFMPTIPSLYHDQEIAAKNTLMPRLLQSFTDSVARPSRGTGENYNKVSTEFFNAAYSVLTKKEKADVALKDLDAKLAGIMK